MFSQNHPDNIILIICGPAGSGKTTLCEHLISEFPDSVRRMVTTTSREPRPGEVNGVDYHFLTREEFEKRIADDAFIEWARVHGRYYGSQTCHLESLLRQGMDILLNIDVQGAATFTKEAVTNPFLNGRIRRVFIKPASIQQLIERLRERGADDEVEIQRRLQSAAEELRVADQFEHVIISGTREADYAALRALYLKLKHF